MTLLRSGSFAAMAVLTACVVLTTCRDSQGPKPSAERATPPSPSLSTSPGPATLVGAGNIAKCGVTGAAATAALLNNIPGTVFAAGDAAYDNGTLTQYNTCYVPSWGPHKARTQPAPGDRDYKTANASGYFGYFGAAAGDPKQGYYSYDLGGWHIIVLNSGSPSLVPTTATSPQVQWLRADLAAHPARCTLAYWHHPLFDSKDNPYTTVRPLWAVLYCAGVEVVVTAHYAVYEGFPRRTPPVASSPVRHDRRRHSTMGWGDATPRAAHTATPTPPISAPHVHPALRLDSVRVTVTNNPGATGADTLVVHVVAPAVLVGAGDIAECTKNGDSLTANLLDGIPGTVFAGGDNAYPDGTSSDYTNCYNPTWGRHKARTRPVPGNHDYNTPGASGYFNYFGAAAGPSGKGYYSYNLGDWHIVALNSNIAMNVGSPQEQWLRTDLASNTKRCTLAYWHHPLFSSGNEGPHIETQPLWQDLYDAGAEVVIVGHDHDYERFAPQTATGIADPAHGIREFVAGTGGGGLFVVYPPVPHSEVLNNTPPGGLQLTLRSAGYDWQFVPIAGKTFTDTGSGSCHHAPPSGANHAPTANAGGPYSGVEGGSVSFDGSGSSDPDGDPLAYAWSFGAGGTGTGVNPSHTYTDNGTYTVTLAVTDAPGASSAAATSTATIANGPPAVNAGPDQTVAVGSPVTLHATFSDGGTDAPWAYAVAWGDGSPPTTGSTTSQASPIDATHSYAAPGSNTVRVTVTDKDGAAG